MIFDALVTIFVVLVGVALLFPVKVRILFGACRREKFLEMRIFGRSLWKWESAPAEDSSAELTAASPLVEEELKSEVPEALADSLGGESAEHSETEEVLAAENGGEGRSETQGKPSSASDLEFFSLMLEPKFDRKLLSKGFRLGRAFFRIFRFRFGPSLVEGVHWERFEQMGYAVGAFGFAKGALPLLKNWDLALDWENSRPLRLDGSCSVSFSFARVLGFLIVSSASVLGLVRLYLKNRRLYRKNPANLRLPLWRRRIVRFLAAD